MRSFPSKAATIFLMVTTLLMYGCGGGGGGSSTPDEPAPPMSEPMAVTIPDGLTLGEAMMQEIAAGESWTSGNVTFSCPAGGDPCKVVVAADGTATSEGGMATAAESEASKTAKAAAAAAARMAAKAAAKTEAMRVAGLIGPEPKLADADVRTASTGNQSIVTLSAPPTDDNFSEPRFQVATTADATGLTSVKFTASDDRPATIDDWTGGIYTHTSEDGNTVHKVTKYNDKADDKAERYSTFFTSDTAGSTTHRAGIAVTSVDANGVLTIDVSAFTTGDTDKIRNNHGLFTGNFGPTTEGTYSFPGVGKVTGTFRGVPGTFNCPETCTSTHDKDGNLSALGGVWTFEPDGIRTSAGALLTDADDGTGNPENALSDALKAIMVPGVKQDADYMIFGYWEQSVTDEGDETTDETMLPFADGKRDYGTVADVTGTATYAGPATGLYMKKTLTSQGVVDQEGDFASGQFTAKAMLTALFGGGNVAANHQFSITGTISEFMDMDGEAIDEDWMVNLNRRMLAGTDTVLGTDDDTPQKNMYGADTTTDGDGSGGTFGGVTHGGTLDDTSNEGGWSGTFHGAVYNADTSPMPVSASGIFDAHFTNGHVRGAFATNKQE